MYKGYSLQSVRRLLSTFALIAMSVFAVSANAQLIRPEVPRLSMTGQEGGYNSSFYPDGRLWVAKEGTNGPREILVPVFLKNCWTPTRLAPNNYPQPIYSFNFKLQYDSTALMPVGIVTRGPIYEGSHPNVIYRESDRPTLADGWQLTWDVAVDSTYQVQTGLISPSNPNRLRGKRIRIAGQSTRALAPTGNPTSQACDAFNYVPLVYVKFRVVGLPGSGVSDVTPIILTTDSIYYNTLRAAYESPFPGDPNYPTPSPDVRLTKTLAGTDYDRQGFEPAAVQTIRQGMIYCHITEAPRFDFAPKPTNNPNETSVINDGDSNTLFIMKRVIPYDPNLQQSQGQARAGIQVILNPDGVRATNITVESDADWLQFQTRGQKNPIPAPTRFGRIAYIDRGILGPPNGVGYPDAVNANIPSVPDPTLNLDIICDPNLLPQQDADNPEMAGKYIGYITFKSQVAEFTPIRLKVTFLYIRSPFESYTGVPPGDIYSRGILINVRNSAPIPQSTNIMFGTGNRATMGPDSLFGEFAYDTPAPTGTFFARWFPVIPNPQTPEEINTTTNGLGDFTGVFASRDIRSVTEDTTLVYRCRFNSGGSNNYPVVITWDVNQFPEGSQLFLRDIENGRIFGVDMRNATKVPGSESQYSYTIRDERITAFDIEYTPARARIQQINEKGWNLVSLPVRPSDNKWNKVYPNAQGTTPIKFAQDIYQIEEELRVGSGYFIRFPHKDTSIISGILVKRIARDIYPVPVYEGWNTIGALSVDANAKDIVFQPINQNTNPPQQVPFTFVYGYNTDRGYQAVSVLKPGKGYWIKSTGEGYYSLTAPTTRSTIIAGDQDAVLAAGARVMVRDNDARENMLYLTEGRVNVNAKNFDLPPTPPSDMFDARFGNNAFVENSANPMLRFQGVSYPVTINVSNNAAGYNVVDAATGNILGSVNKGSGSIVIRDENVKAVRLLSSESNEGFSMKATPNPTEGKAQISFNLPETQQVTVTVYNAMGQAVSTLMNQVATKGQNMVNFDASNLSSGSYLVKVVAGDFVAVQTVTVTK